MTRKKEKKIIAMNHFNEDECILIKELAAQAIKEDKSQLRYWDKNFKNDKSLEGLVEFNENCIYYNKIILKNPNEMFDESMEMGFLFAGFFIGHIEATDQRKQRKIKKSAIKKIEAMLIRNPHSIKSLKRFDEILNSREKSPLRII